MSSALSAVFLGLASAACWGAGDFTGGVVTKRNNVYTVVIVSQLAGIAFLIGLTLLLAEPLPPIDGLLLGAAAGISGAIAILALYSSLASGRMSIVAPITAVVTATVPVIFGLFIEGLPAMRQLLGFGIAFLAIWLITRTGDGTTIRARDLGLPLVAGLASGIFLILIDQASDISVLWPIVAARLASISFVVVAAILLKQGGLPNVALLPIMALAGILEVGGSTLFAFAARSGRLDIAAILASLYPAVTVMLAWIILKERLIWQQWLGLVAALAAVILIAL